MSLTAIARTVMPLSSSREQGLRRASAGASNVTESPPLPLPFSMKGARMMPMGGSAATAAGGRAAIGSLRYCFKSSSAIGRVEKYENLLVMGIISPRNRAASSATVDLGCSAPVVIAIRLYQGAHA